MFEKIKSYFPGRNKQQKEIVEAGKESIQSVQDIIKQKITNNYRARQNFNGEKFSGGMNYNTAFGSDKSQMRLRSLRAYNDSMQARAIIKRLRDTVINTGLSLESTPEASILGLSQDERKDMSNKIESRFNLWANSKNCDVSKDNTLGQIERILFNNQLIKGDYFAILPFSNDPDLINPLQIKLINPERVSTPFGTKDKSRVEKKGGRIVDGIEFDKNDEEVAIYVKTKKPGEFNSGWERIAKYGKQSGRVVLIHGKTSEFGNEARGVPALAHVAHELEKITDYSLLELMAAVANATIAMTVVPGDNADATNPFPAGTFVPPTLQPPSGALTNDASEAGYTNIGQNQLKNTGGFLVSGLSKGETIESHDTKRPNVNFGAFVDSIMVYLAASQSMPIEVAQMKFGQNFSASRAALKLYWQSLDVWRDEIVSDFLTPVYNSWLLGEVGTGNLILNGFLDPNLRAAWQSAKWVGVPSPSIDPFKEERAAQIRVKEGFTTREHESQTRHKTSFDSNVVRLKSENELLAEANEPLKDEQQETVVA